MQIACSYKVCGHQLCTLLKTWYRQFCFDNLLLFPAKIPWLLLSFWWTTAYSATETSLRLTSPKACKSSDSISFWNVGVLFETSTFCGKFPLRLIYFVFNGSVSCSSRKSSHASLYISFPVSVTGDINPSGSKINAKCFKIPSSDCSFPGISKPTPNVSIDLFQGILEILQSVGWVANSCFAYESSGQSSSCVCSNSFAFECHLCNYIPTSPKIFLMLPWFSWLSLQSPRLLNACL